MADMDLDGRPDLVFIKRRSTGTGTIEVHVLSAASGFGTFIQDTGTALSGAEDGNGDFTMADVDRDGRPDLVFFKGQNTGTDTVELHAVSAVSGFQQFTQDIASGFSQVDDGNGDFTMKDVNLDGMPDLVFIKRRSTGTGTIELHGLAG